MIGLETSRIVYKGDGITKEFPYTFTVQEKTDMVVTLVHEDGTNEVLTKDYFVDLDKKTVNYPGYAPGEEPAEAERPEILPAGSYLVLSRNIPITQETYLGDKWPWNVNEDELDKITMILQDLKEASDRHLTLSAEVEGVDVTLPSPKANMGFYWDETGTKLVEGLNPNAATEQAAASAALSGQYAADAKGSADYAGDCAAKLCDGINEAKQAAEQAKEHRDAAADSAATATQKANSARDSAEEAETWATKARQPLIFKGGVETYDELPANPNVGDYYYIEKADEEHGILAGNNVGWDGTQWVNMGNTEGVAIATDPEIQALFDGVVPEYQPDPEHAIATAPEIQALF